MPYRLKDVDSEGRVPLGNWFGFAVLVILLLLVLGAGVSVAGWLGGWFSEAGQVAREQAGPRALLRKYEWFKDAYAQLEAKRANILAYDARIAALDKRGPLSRTAEEQRNLWLGEKAGVVASYNDLAAEYNAQMAKANYRFTNVGDLPQGSSDPLPRNVISYQEGQ